MNYHPHLPGDESFYQGYRRTGKTGDDGDRQSHDQGIQKVVGDGQSGTDTQNLNKNGVIGPEVSFQNCRRCVVVHLAAHAKVFELVKNPARALENIEMVFGVLEYCRKNEVPIIFASSREVYGDIHRWITDEGVADFVVAESPYSASKITGEALIYSYFQCYKLPHLVFRFSNVYGRYDCDLERMERVIPLFIHRIANEEPIRVFGKNKVLDFTYVDDCSTGITSGIDRLVSGEITNQTVNLAYGRGSSLEDLVNILALALNKEPNAEYLPSRPGEVTRYVADISKARALLEYNPDTPLSLGLRKSIEWQREIGALS